MQFQSTKFVTLQSLENNPPKVGQWVNIDGSLRGQYLGTTSRGTLVIRYQNNKFAKRDAMGNKHLRAFAKNYGAE